jgi:hypothetical protein
MGPLLKIRNRETGEVADLSRDVCVTHPEWVHEQCGTSSEPELQHMLDQRSYDEFAHNPDSEDEAGIFMDAKTATAYLAPTLTELVQTEKLLAASAEETRPHDIEGEP